MKDEDGRVKHSSFILPPSSFSPARIDNGQLTNMHIKTNDTVEVITGDDKGVRKKVLHIDREKGRVVVEGVTLFYKHVRRSQRNPQGGRLSKEMPVQISNVLLVCNRCNQGVRT